MPAKYKSCVAKVARKGVRSPHAVCTKANAGNIKSVRKKEARSGRARRKR